MLSRFQSKYLLPYTVWVIYQNFVSHRCCSKVPSRFLLISFGIFIISLRIININIVNDVCLFSNGILYLLLAYTSFNWFMRFVITNNFRLSLLKINLQRANVWTFLIKIWNQCKTSSFLTIPYSHVHIKIMFCKLILDDKRKKNWKT